VLNNLLCTCAYTLVGTTVGAPQCGVSWASKLGGAHPSPSSQQDASNPDLTSTVGS